MIPIIRTTLSLFFIFLTLAASAHAAMVLPLGLDNLHGKAKLVFLGECLSNSVAMDSQSGRVATYTTFAVLENFKGSAGATHTIKQVGGNLPGASLQVRVSGVPQFEVGQRYVVFLPQVSELGFSTPVGLGQGVFKVTSDKATGAQMVSNGRDVGELMENIAHSKLPGRVADMLRAMPSKEVPAQARARAVMHLDDLRSTLLGME